MEADDEGATDVLREPDPQGRSGQNTQMSVKSTEREGSVRRKSATVRAASTSRASPVDQPSSTSSSSAFQVNRRERRCQAVEEGVGVRQRRHNGL